MRDDFRRTSKSKETVEDRVRREEEDKRKAAQFELDCRYLIDDPHFVRYIKTVFERGNMMNSVFTGNSQTYYLSGKQDLTRQLFADFLKINKEKAVKLLLPEEE